MKKEIGAEGALGRKLAEFFESESICLKVEDFGEAVVSVSAPGGRLESCGDSIFAGGWVKCETARHIAEKLGVTRKEMGKILNFLDVKICDCELGCF